MTGKRFFVFLTALLLLALAVFGGGCGGGSHNNDDIDPDDLSMASVEGTPEYEAMLAELEADGTMAEVEKHGIYKYTGGENAEEEVLAAYESGKVVMLFEPTAEDVNGFLQLLGSLSMNVEDIAPNTKGLELFAMARKKDSDGKSHRCTYIVTHRADATVSDETVELAPEEGDASKEDSGSEATVTEKQTEAEPEYSEVEFQVDRWREFYKWIAGLDDAIKANAASMSDYEVRAAADDDDLTKLSEAQIVTLDLSVSKKLSGFNINGAYCPEFERTMNRRNVLTFTIYSAHSFKSKDDFYIVRGNMSTTPRNYQDTMVRFTDGDNNTLKCNFVYGYTKETDLFLEIDDGNKLSASDLSLIEVQPANVNRSTTYSKTTTESISGKIGVNKDGPSAEIGGGVSYSNSQSWTTSEYSIVNHSFSNSFEMAAWATFFDYCDGGSEHDYEGKYHGDSHDGEWDGVNATPASTVMLELPVYAVFQVKENYWKNHSKINLIGWLYVSDGWTTGYTDVYKSGWHTSVLSYGRQDNTDTGCKGFSFALKQPPHAAVTQRKFDLDSDGTSKVSFTLLAEDNWTITDIPDWITFTRTSGGATGEDGTLIYGQANRNIGSDPRYASLTLTSGRENITIEVGQLGTGQ